MSKNKSKLHILYLSGETYKLDGVKEYWYEGAEEVVPNNQVMLDPDHKESRLVVHYFNKKRKTEIIEKIPTADIELFIVREHGGNRVEAVRLHRKKDEVTRVTIDV